MLKAQIKTKSNFRGVNGLFLVVHELHCKRVTCYLPDGVLADFTLDEIEQFSQLKF